MEIKIFMTGEGNQKKTMRIAIDMTPYNSDGSNGGLVQALMSTIDGLIRKGMDITVLTTANNHDSLLFLEKKGLKRFNISQQASADVEAATSSVRTSLSANKESYESDILENFHSANDNSIIDKLLRLIRKAIKMLLPHFVVVLVLRYWWWFQKVYKVLRHPVRHIKSKIERTVFEIQNESIENKAKEKRLEPLSIFLEENIDVLYCPFTAIPPNESNVPVVSVLHDIQHKYMPYNFSPQEIATRDAFYEKICAQRPYIVCDSNYTKKTFHETYNFPEERMETTYLVTQDRFSCFSDDNLETALKRLGLSAGGYIYYPANDWPHKNHRSLLLAFRMLLEQNAESDLKLVFSGARTNTSNELPLEEAIRILGLETRVLHVGYVSDLEVGALVKYCKFIIYPSYFEGLGLPLVEAMSMNTTIICSNVTSLPEVGGMGAFYFNPYDPASICNTMEYVLGHPQEAEEKKKYYPALMERFSVDGYTEKIVNILERVGKERTV